MTERNKRINELANLSKERELTEEEKEEQIKLRKEYIDAFRKNMRQQLDNTYVIDAKGNKIAVKDLKK